MVGQRLARDLPAGDASAVGERGQEDRIDATLLLKDVEHLLDALIDQ